MIHLQTPSKAASERGRLSGLATRQALAADLGKDTLRNGAVAWHMHGIYLMGVPQFEQWLVKRFGPEYLEPVPYHWVDGQLVPVTESAEAPGSQEGAVAP